MFYALGEDGERFWPGMPDEAIEKYKNIRTPNEGWVVASDHNVQVEASQKWIMRLLPSAFIEKINWKRQKICHSIQLTNGSDITFKSSEAGSESFEGAGKRWIWFDEEPKYESVYNECVLRESGTVPLQMWGTMTPVRGLTWTFDRVWKRRDEKDSLIVLNWSTYDNPYLPDEMLEELELEFKDEPKEKKRRLYGLFVERTGLVYNMFDRDKHVQKPFEVPRDWDLYEGIDLGHANESAVVWMALAPSNKFYVIDEFYEPGLTVSELGDRIMEKRREGTYTEKGDYTPRLSLIDPASQSRHQQLEKRTLYDADGNELDNARKVLRRKGVWTKQGNNAVRSGIEIIRSMLRDGTSGPDLFVFETCENWIEEIENYRLKHYTSEKARSRKNKPEEPRKKDDHLMDATRYVCNEQVQWVGPTGNKPRSYSPKRSRVTSY